MLDKDEREIQNSFTLHLQTQLSKTVDQNPEKGFFLQETIFYF